LSRHCAQLTYASSARRSISSRVGRGPSPHQGLRGFCVELIWDQWFACRVVRDANWEVRALWKTGQASLGVCQRLLQLALSESGSGCIITLKTLMILLPPGGQVVLFPVLRQCPLWRPAILERERQTILFGLLSTTTVDVWLIRSLANNAGSFWWPGGCARLAPEGGIS